MTWRTSDTRFPIAYESAFRQRFHDGNIKSGPACEQFGSHVSSSGIPPIPHTKGTDMLRLKKTIAVGLAALIAMGFAASAANAANGFANGGFESTAPVSPLPPGGVTSFASNWLSAPTGNPVTLSNDAHSGLHSALLSVPGGFGGSTLFQNSIDQGMLAPLTVGDTPVLSFWSKGDVSTTGNVGFALRFLDGTGGILYNSGNQQFQGSINTSTWSKITFAAAAVPAGAVAAFLEINTAVGPLLDGRANAVLIDDINLQVAGAVAPPPVAAVPEPGTYALMFAGLGGIAVVVRRRRV